MNSEGKEPSAKTSIANVEKIKEKMPIKTEKSGTPAHYHSSRV